MEVIRSTVLAVCTVFLAAGLVRVAAPTGHMQKTVRLVAGLCLLACVLTPAWRSAPLNWQTLFSDDAFAPQDALPRQTEHLLEQAAVEQAVAIVQAAAAAHGLQVRVDRVQTQLRNGVVYIDRVEARVNGTAAQAALVARDAGCQIKGEIEVLPMEEKQDGL